MRDYIRERVLQEANYIVVTGATIRETAKRFGVSKSTVHRDMRHLLPEINMNLYFKVGEILDFNYAERHIRGGRATKEKYKKMQEKGTSWRWLVG